MVVSAIIRVAARRVTRTADPIKVAEDLVVKVTASLVVKEMWDLVIRIAVLLAIRVT